MVVQLLPQDVRAGGVEGEMQRGEGREATPHHLASREEGLLLVTYSLNYTQTI